MFLDPVIPRLVAALLVVLTLALVLRRLRQPFAVIYIVAGVLLGPHVLGLLDDPDFLERLGELGVIVLLFFVGMEVSLPNLLKEWKVPVLGTVFQIALSVAITVALSELLGWRWQRGLLLGFVISLSSTAVVLEYLKERGDIETRTGRDVVGVLVTQDLALAPMLVILGLLQGDRPTPLRLGFQVIVASGLIALAWAMARQRSVRFRLGTRIRTDHELQVIVALVACLGLATLSGVAGLSTAFGAFVAGVVVGTAEETSWVQRSLEPFRVVFVAAFLLSIGTLIDPAFVWRHALEIGLLTLAAFVTNFFVNGAIFRLLGRPWGESAYGAALLAQVGEFSFLLAAIGLQAGIISEFGSQLTISVIALSLLFAPAWSAAFRRLRPTDLEAAGTLEEHA